MFCKTCGVHLFRTAAEGESPWNVMPLNLRALHEVKLEELNVAKHNGRNSSPSSEND